MTAAAVALPRSPVFGIVSCPVGPDTREFEIGWDEHERDVDWAESLLRSAGLGSGDLVLITISQWEGPWTTPVVHALRRIGVTFLCAEVWSFDSRRTSMFLQRLPVKAIFGLGGETLRARPRAHRAACPAAGAVNTTGPVGYVSAAALAATPT